MANLPVPRSGSPPLSPSDPNRARAASVRVRRMTRTNVLEGTPASPAPPSLPQVSETSGAPAAPNSPASLPPPIAQPGTPVVGRRRAVTVSEHLRARFEEEGVVDNGIESSVERKASRNRMRARSIGQRSGRASEDIALEPNVQIAGQPQSRSRVGSIHSHAVSHDVEPLTEEEEHHAQDEVDLLDVIDPQVATAAYLSNIASAIAVPALPFLNRAPVIDLDTPPVSRRPSAFAPGHDAIDVHAEHVLDRKAERREKLRQVMRGAWAFLKTPLGIFFAIYGFAVVFFGAGLVLILIHAIPMPSDDRRNYWVEVFSQILNALFTITGVGLIPWRTIDTYHASCMWTIANRVWRRRRQRGMEPLPRADDLPLHAHEKSADSLEAGKACDVIDEETLLTEKEEQSLLRHQVAFQKSQTWYRPHETSTHYAFPMKWALVIVCLNVGNSFFQCCLCGTMWGLNRFERPAWTTGILIPLSFLCGIFAGVFIWRIGKGTKKVTEVEAAIRAAAKAAKESEAAAHPHTPHTPHLPHLHFFGHSQPRAGTTTANELESEKVDAMSPGDDDIKA